MDQKFGHKLAEIKCALKRPGVSKIVILSETRGSLHGLLAEFIQFLETVGPDPHFLACWLAGDHTPLIVS